MQWQRFRHLLLISLVADATLDGATLTSRHREDPMIRRGWLEQGLRWYDAPACAEVRDPLEVGPHGLPPMLVQVGDQELLLSDATRLADRDATCEVPCRLEVHAARWHVFHLQSFYLQSAVAVGTAAEQVRSVSS
ncbi:alpha/beta hydrolase fold [Collimonas sp. OK307]|nr:alpha/beta hydrolase fold [Collimonas sp. OK307]